jgi:hypothetical protein
MPDTRTKFLVTYGPAKLNFIKRLLSKEPFLGSQYDSNQTNFSIHITNYVTDNIAIEGGSLYFIYRKNKLQ